LVLHGAKTPEAAKEVGKAVRAQHSDPKTVAIANIVDLRAMGGLWRRVAEAQIKSTYEKMAAKITVGDPADFIVICPDWDGSVAKLFGVSEPDREPGVVVLDAQGRIVGMATGNGLGEKVGRLLA
jgi:hypothetical protein